MPMLSSGCPNSNAQPRRFAPIWIRRHVAHCDPGDPGLSLPPEPAVSPNPTLLLIARASDFASRDTKGSAARPSDYRGRVVLLAKAMLQYGVGSAQSGNCFRR
jgi:hypothetical protein